MSTPIIKPLSHLQLERSYGVSKSALRSAMMSYFNLPPQHRELMAYYKAFNLPGDIFRKNAHEGLLANLYHVAHFQVERDDTRYAIVYQDCSYATACKAPLLKLSYRKALPEYGLPAIVIVRIASKRLATPTPNKQTTLNKIVDNWSKVLEESK